MSSSHPAEDAPRHSTSSSPGTVVEPTVLQASTFDPITTSIPVLPAVTEESSNSHHPPAEPEGNASTLTANNLVGGTISSAIVASAERSSSNTNASTEAKGSESSPSSDNSGSEINSAATAVVDDDDNTPEEWLSVYLRAPFVVLLLATLLGTFVVIVALLAYSIHHQGIIDVSNAAKSTRNVFGVELGISLAYSGLVVVLFQVWGMGYAATIQALGTRQPYVELRGDLESNSGPTAMDSFFVDYTKSFFFNVKEAWNHKHLILFVGFVSSIVVTFILVPLSGTLLNVGPKASTHSAKVMFASTYNDTGFGAFSDLVPAFDIVAAANIYGGNSPPWTTAQYAFRNFSVPSDIKSTALPANVSVDIDAYASTLMCRILDLPTELKPNATADKLANTVLDDNGCTYSILYGFGITGQNYDTYLQTFSTTSCDISAGWSRLGVFAARLVQGESNKQIFTDITIISCNTSYQHHFGTLAASYPSAAQGTSVTPSMLSYNVTTTEVLDKPSPDYWKNWESQLHQASIIDTGEVLAGTNFGSLIYRRAQLVDPSNNLDPTALLDATTDMYTAVFAIMASQYLFDGFIDSDNDASTTGDLTISRNRLYVVAFVASLMIGIMLFVTVILVSVFIYVRSHESILLEEPNPIHGPAQMLRNSYFIEKHVQRLLNQSGSVKDGKVWKEAKRQAREDESGWRLNNWRQPGSAKIECAPPRMQSWGSWKSKHYMNKKDKTSSGIIQRNHLN